MDGYKLRGLLASIIFAFVFIKSSPGRCRLATSKSLTKAYAFIEVFFRNFIFLVSQLYELFQAIACCLVVDQMHSVIMS